MAKKKLICLFSFIMIFLIRGIVYSQYIPYQGKRVITTAAGFKVKLNITCFYKVEEIQKRIDIAEGIIKAYDEAVLRARDSSCLPISTDGKKCVRKAIINYLNHNIPEIIFYSSGVHGSGQAGGNTIEIWNAYEEYYWSSDKQGKEVVSCTRGLMLHELLHLPGYDEDIAEGCSLKCFPCAPKHYGYTEKDCKCKKPEEDGDGPDRSPPSRPGGDHPDDNYSVASFLPTDGVSESRNPELLVLRNGFWEEGGSFINRLKRSFSYIEPDQSPLEMKDPPPILFIPSGGLYGMEKSLQFRSILEDYVSQGGTIIVFAQQHGYEYKALPQSEEIEAHGWREDISCFWKSTYIDRWHPVFTSSTDSLITMSIDGYFTNVPGPSTVLLSRRLNGMPSFFYYAYGEGVVVLISSFEDYMFRNFGAPEKRKAVARDLFTWARNPGLEIPEYNLRDNPSPEVSLDLEARNISDKAASNMKILWLDPDRNQIFEEEKLVSIPVGEGITIPIVHTLSEIEDSKLGIWHVDYILYDSEGDETQPQLEADSGRFSISRPSTEFFESYDLMLEITTPNKNALRGTDVDFKARFTNRADQDKTLHLYWDWSLQSGGQQGEYWDEVVVPANGTLEKEITVSLSLSASEWARFYVHIFEEGGEGTYRSLKSIKYLQFEDLWPYVGSAYEVIHALRPSVEAGVQADKELYRRGKTVNTVITCKNSINIPYDPTINYRVIGPLKEIIYEYTFVKHLEANDTVQENVNFSLPSDAKYGRYGIYIRVLNPLNQNRIEFAYTFLNILAPQLTSKVTLPSIYQLSSINTVSFVLTNTGLIEISDGYVGLKLLDPEGQLVFQEQQNFSLPLGQSTTLNFDISLPDIKFGDYKLTYTVFDGENISGPIEKVIPSKVSMNVAFDKDSYRMRDDMNIDLNAINWGKFVSDLTLNLKIPSFEYDETRNITLNPGQKQDFTFSTQVPTNIGNGLHLAEVTLALPSGSQLKETLSFTVPESDLAVTSDKAEYSAGDNIEFIISNSGGVDAPFSYEVELSDLKQGIIIYQSSGEGEAQAGGTIPVTFTIPSQAVNGDYYLKVKAIDNLTNKPSGVNKEIFISGIKADLEVKTGKEIYLNTEDITLLSKVINSDKEIVEANLNLQVLELDKWKHYSDPFDSWITDIAVDKENNIWFGTTKGVVKYDGANWVT